MIKQVKQKYMMPKAASCHLEPTISYYKFIVKTVRCENRKYYNDFDFSSNTYGMVLYP